MIDVFACNHVSLISLSLLALAAKVIDLQYALILLIDQPLLLAMGGSPGSRAPPNSVQISFRLDLIGEPNMRPG